MSNAPQIHHKCVSRSHHRILTFGESNAYYRKTDPLGKDGKSHIPTSSLVDQYILTCRTEGKTFSTIRGYREKLRRFLGWGEAAKLGDFTVEMVRDYISHLQSAHKFEGHPFNPTQAKLLSQAAVRNLVIVLRSFSSRLDRELYTAENVLKRLQVPRAPVKVIEALTDEEIEQLFSSLNQRQDGNYIGQ